MPDKDVFNTDTTVDNTVVSQEVTNTFETIVGEGKQYQTPDALATGKLEADKYIENLQAELAGVRKDLDGRINVEEALAKFKEGSTSQEESTTPVIDEDYLNKAVTNAVNANNVAGAKANNFNQANSKMIETFGDKAAVTLADKSVELGMTVQDLKSIAEQSPQAFYNMMGMTTTAPVNPSVTAPKSTVTENFAPTSTVKEGTYAYFEQIRKESPSKYWTPAVQNAMHKNASAMGDDFYK